MSAEVVSAKRRQDFHLTVLGRTLEHLGVQMYKQRPIALAELVANCWDAGANNVWIEVLIRQGYDPDRSRITITDDGEGMNAAQVEHEYLVVGRNRREASSHTEQSAVIPNNGGSQKDMPETTASGVVSAEPRPVMGRKGIGKLAGFGLARTMRIITWKDGESVDIVMDIDRLKLRSGEVGNVTIPGLIGDVPSSARTATGTTVILQSLKHSTALEIDNLRESLARRFSRRVRGRMNIFINDEQLGEPHLKTEYSQPDVAEAYITEPLLDGTEIKYRYAFAETPISSSEMRGFTIYVHGKTAQTPPFYFHVESRASGQHAAKYLTGEIEADYLDDSTDDESDIISTDRQEIDWDNDRVHALHIWGEQLTRRLFREWADRHGERVESWILSDENLNSRIEKLERKTQTQIREFLRRLGSVETQKERALDLAGSLVRAYEYRHFIDVIQEIEEASDDPEALQTLLRHLHEWNVLESRAILEIIKGRLSIIEKFHDMIVNNVPETKSSKSMDNLHDMIAGQPWLLNPEWQVLYEERSVTTLLRDWGYEEVEDVNERERFDFLALKGSGQLVVIEIKRSGHPVTYDELIRLERYRNRLAKAHSEKMHMVMIYGGGLDPSVSPQTKENWEKRDDAELREWSEIHSTTRDYYEHYRAVLEGNVDHPDFQKKEIEVRQIRGILAKGTVHRDTVARNEGLGSQDSNYLPAAPAPVREAVDKPVVRKLIKKDSR